MNWQKRWFVHAANKAMKKRQTAETAHALVSWLGRPRWDVFWTQTYRSELSAKATMAMFLSGLAELFSQREAMAALWTVEPHTTRRSHHVHSLLAVSSPALWSNLRTKSARSTACSTRSRSGPSSTTNKCLWLKEWGWKRYGIARVWPVTSTQKVMVTSYVVKYLMKRVNHALMTAWSEEEVARMNDEKLWGIEISDERFSIDDEPYPNFFTIDEDRSTL